MRHDGDIAPTSPRGDGLQGRQRSARQWPELVIFDCDGVLIDSEIVVCRLTAEEFSRLGYAITTTQVIQRFAGRPEREMIADVEAEWGRSVPEEFFARMSARVEDAYATELQIMPGITELLQRLCPAVCVASSASPAKLRLGLEAVDLYRTFAPDVVSASSVARGKPAPDVFIYAAGRMGNPV